MWLTFNEVLIYRLRYSQGPDSRPSTPTLCTPIDYPTDMLLKKEVIKTITQRLQSWQKE
jgi:hypothetical protein